MVRLVAAGATAAALFSSVHAAPLVARQGITDGDILSFALVLEHLENVFYKEGLAKFPESAFLDAGFSSQTFDNLKYTAFDEEAHVTLLTSALEEAGASPPAACEYSFPYTDPASFLALASVLEGVGSAAYLGAAPAIADKSYLSVAGSILVTEALHTSVQRLAVNKIAAANPYGSALIPNAAYTLAAAFITSCPEGNAPLPFKAFPTLSATQGIPAAPGITFTFTTEAQLPSDFFVTFVNGLVTASEPATVDGSMISATIPLTVSGQTYAILTTANVTAVDDSVVIAGPAILEVTPNAPAYDPTIL